MSKITDAICNSQRLDNAGPPVVGVIGDEMFTLTGVIKQPGEQTLVCVRGGDRTHLKTALPRDKSRQLDTWTEQECRQYSGFYVPITWFETTHVMSREEWLVRSLERLLWVADTHNLDRPNKQACTCEAMRGGYTCPYCEARAAVAWTTLSTGCALEDSCPNFPNDCYPEECPARKGDACLCSPCVLTGRDEYRDAEPRCDTCPLAGGDDGEGYDLHEMIARRQAHIRPAAELNPEYVYVPKGEATDPVCPKCGEPISAVEVMMGWSCGDCTRKAHREVTGR